MSSTIASSADGELLKTEMTTPSFGPTVSGLHGHETSNGNPDSKENNIGCDSSLMMEASSEDVLGTSTETRAKSEEPSVKANGLDLGLLEPAGLPPDGLPTDIDSDYQSDPEDEKTIARELGREINRRTLAKSLEERRKTAKKRNLQASQYLILVEDRLKELEDTVARLQSHKSADKLETKQDAIEDPLPMADTGIMPMQPARFSWRRFHSPTSEQLKETRAIMEFLVEPPYSLAKEAKLPGRASRQGPESAVPSHEQTSPVERIRNNSILIEDIFREVLDNETAPLMNEAIVKPFKAIVPYAAALSAKAAELEENIAAAPSSPIQSDGLSSVDNSEDGPPALEAAATERDNATISEADAITATGEVVDLPFNFYSKGTLEHLRVLIDAINTDLKLELQTHHLLRSRHKDTNSSVGGAKISFPDLWHLFAPGDLVYDPIDNQALRVLAVRGGRQLLAREATNRYTDPLDLDLGRPFEPKPVGAVAQLLIADDQISDFVLTCFYLDFNGECVGPVQTDKYIEPFDGVKEVRNLSVLPIEYADSQAFRIGRTGAGGATDAAQSVQEILLARGQKFASLSRSKEVSHCDYNGFSLGRVRDQIDSQVIIDLDLYYQKYPEAIIELGLREPAEGEIREVQESYIRSYSDEVPEYSLLSENSKIFDDRKVDKFRTNEFLAKNQFLVRFTEPRSQQHMLASDDCVILFPRQIWAFVLRNRTWAPLDVGRVADLKPRIQSFKELVLPQKHKDIVEALVRTHSRGAHSVEDAAGVNDTDQREDLVRGKGKGVILLLHGVPGVGKTSTAECVAEYTKRPLFALTCGDIGDNARDVEANLTESFQLAHRWGCVMLLDEADVFLQSRSRDRDLGRNAVVSVFLGMLEYYSGILFLTTNKIGTFDEAFKSRIHVSLLYQELDKKQTMEIWRLNLARIAETRKGRVTFDQDAMMDWMKKFFKRCNSKRKDGVRPWNGRQIKNACQTAAALAEFQNNGEITKEELNAVADASAQFDSYLNATHGTDDAGRAEARIDRADDKFAEYMKKAARSSDRSPPRSQRRKERSPSPKKSSSKKKGKADKTRTTKSESSSGSGSSSSDSE